MPKQACLDRLCYLYRSMQTLLQYFHLQVGPKSKPHTELSEIVLKHADEAGWFREICYKNIMSWYY